MERNTPLMPGFPSERADEAERLFAEICSPLEGICRMVTADRSRLARAPLRGAPGLSRAKGRVSCS